MNRQLNQIIQVLRTEVQEYGALLDLVDQKHAAIVHGEADHYLSASLLLDHQLEVLGAARGVREGLVESYSRRVGCPSKTPLTELLPTLPSNVRGLITALVSEMDALIARSRCRLQQNHRLLARCVEMGRDEAAAEQRELQSTAHR